MTKTVSLPTAKLLKEAGYHQLLSQYVYGDGKLTSREQQGTYKSYNNIVDQGCGCCMGVEKSDVQEWLAAPDTTELLEVLPKRISLYKQSKWYVRWNYAPTAHPEHNKKFAEAYADTPAEALAALWLELRKQKII